MNAQQKLAEYLRRRRESGQQRRDLEATVARLEQFGRGDGQVARHMRETAARLPKGPDHEN